MKNLFLDNPGQECTSKSLLFFSFIIPVFKKSLSSNSGKKVLTRLKWTLRHCRKWIANTWLMKVCQLISVHQTTQQRFKNKIHAWVIQYQIAKYFWFLKRAKFAHLSIQNKQPDLSIYIFFERIWMVTEREIEKMNQSGKLLQNYSLLSFVMCKPISKFTWNQNTKNLIANDLQGCMMKLWVFFRVRSGF